VTRLFLSYRRADAGPDVGRLADRLRRVPAFRDGGVFVDVDAIAPGRDFADVIRAAIRLTDVLVAVIGPGWLAARDDRGRRLDDPADPVRGEIAAALADGVPVLAVLVRGAGMPRADDLPEAIRPLGQRNAVDLSEGRYEYDFDRLAQALTDLADGAADAPRRRAEEATAEGYYQIGMAHLSRKDFALANASLRKAIRLRPDLADAHRGLAAGLQIEAHAMILRDNYGLATERIEESERHVKAAWDERDADPRVYVQLGYSRKELAQAYRAIRRDDRAGELLGQARAHFQMALGVDRRDPTALNGLGSVALIAGDYDEAIKRITAALKQEPRYAAALFDLAQAYYAKALGLPDGREKLKTLDDVLTACHRLAALQAEPDGEALSPEALQHLIGIGEAAMIEAKRLVAASKSPTPKPKAGARGRGGRRSQSPGGGSGRPKVRR
jgi:tetratricopeptide (TPR) repeat protein